MPVKPIMSGVGAAVGGVFGGPAGASLGMGIGGAVGETAEGVAGAVQGGPGQTQQIPGGKNPFDPDDEGNPFGGGLPGGGGWM